MGRVVGRHVVAIFLAGAIKKLPITCKNSGLTGIFSLRDGSIGKKVIGHGMRGRAARFAIETQIWISCGAFTLLRRQPREGCVGVVVHPLIKQSRNLLADIGGVRKTRQFTPRGLERASGYTDLRNGYRAYVNL